MKYKIDFFDRDTGLQTGTLNDSADQRVLSEFAFELNESGCGAFNLLFIEAHPGFTLKRNDKVKIYLLDATAPWFTGFISNIPEEGRTDLDFNFSGFGYYGRLEDLIINADYSGISISNIIKALLDTYITPNTEIRRNDTKIDATAFTPADAVYDYAGIKRAINDAAKQEGGFVAGVDAEQDFFFKARSTAIQVAAVKAIEKHIESFAPKEDTSKVINRIYAFGSAPGGKSELLAIVQDAASQADYGLKEGIATIPGSATAADAAAWAQDTLDNSKEPKETAAVKGIDILQLGEKIEAIGKARILLRKL